MTWIILESREIFAFVLFWLNKSKNTCTNEFVVVICSMFHQHHVHTYQTGKTAKTAASQWQKHNKRMAAAQSLGNKIFPATDTDFSLDDDSMMLILHSHRVYRSRVMSILRCLRNNATHTLIVPNTIRNDAGVVCFVYSFVCCALCAMCYVLMNCKLYVLS